ncbi:MAG: GNAT family N-acetyltransferase [Chthoniobacterales bacterium]|nr:GNAT family N-acetyltransferase [Chthoniobacterales bacterium]
MQIIRAQPTDAPGLSAIAFTAKAHWGYPAHWLEQWRDQLTITSDFIAANETFKATIAERAVGFHALLRTQETTRLEHLWVLPDQMGKGIGRALFTHAATRAAALGVFRLTIEADPNAEPFYRHLGAVRIGSTSSKIEGQHRELPLLAFDITTL